MLKAFKGLALRSNPESGQEREHDDANYGNVLFDSGANCCVTHCKDDFKGRLHLIQDSRQVEGIGKALQIAGVGTVTWVFKADNGTHRTIRVPAYYVPSANSRVASLQVILRTLRKERISLDDRQLRLEGYEDTPSLTVPYHPTTQLPMAELTVHTEPTTPAASLLVGEVNHSNAYVMRAERSRSRSSGPQLPTRPQQCVTSPTNVNLSESEKELLRWHQRLGHISIRRVQWLMRQGLLSTSERTRSLHSTASKLAHGPMCAACQYAKQRRTPAPGTLRKVIKDQLQALKTDNLYPGARISVDHFHCNPLGRLITSFGKEKSSTAASRSATE